MSLRDSFAYNGGMYKRPSIPDGKQAEAGIFGVARISPKERPGDDLSFEAALDFARKHQPDLFHRSPVLKRLRAAIADLCHDSTSPVRFYTAIDTPLDTLYGIDGFFEQNGRIATVDISLRDKETQKADVLLRVAMNDDGELHIDDREFADTCHKVAAVLNGRSGSLAA